jgi:hypothetical protein
MPEKLSLAALNSLLSEEPANKRAGKKRALAICAIGSYDANKEIENQKRRRHYTNSFDAVNTRGASDSFPYSTPKHRKANQGKKRDGSLATFAVKYDLRDRSLYWYGHSIADMANYYKRGVITQGEWREFYRNVKLMGRRENA